MLGKLPESRVVVSSFKEAIATSKSIGIGSLEGMVSDLLVQQVLV